MSPRAVPNAAELTLKLSLKKLDWPQVNVGPGKQGFRPERNRGCVCWSVQDQMMVWSPVVEKYFHRASPINNGGQPVKINVSTPREPSYLRRLITFLVPARPQKCFHSAFLLMGLQEGN